MGRNKTRTEKVPVLDLFEDIATEPLQANDVVTLIFVNKSNGNTDSDSPTVSFESARFGESTSTVSA